MNKFIIEKQPVKFKYMNKIFTLFFALVMGLAVQAQSVTVTVGAGYANDVFYSFENGTVATVDRANWDIGFNTSPFSISIIANHGSGVEVYSYPSGDTSAWATLDTANMNWPQLYNSLDSWDDGAFAQNDLGHPDYGWGIYNMGNHHITGDSLFVLKTVNGDYKKLWIVEKNAVANIWTFKYADIDGSNEQVVTLNAGTYDTKNFVYYSIDNNQIEDREPVSEDWDILFTKYFDYTIPYAVTGVLSNEAHTLIEEVSQSGLDQATFVTYTEANFASDISIVGSDWKSFNMGTFAYDVADSTVFFAKTYNSNGDSVYHKFYFTAFGGSSTGDYVFNQTLLLHTDVEAIESSNTIEVYPNPAQDQVNVVLDYEGLTSVRIYDMNGKVVFSTEVEQSNILPINIENLQQGIYFLQVINNGNSYSQKIVKQ
jgi:hypothetical protein